MKVYVTALADSFTKHFGYNKYDNGSAKTPSQKQIQKGITSRGQNKLNDCDHSARGHTLKES